MADGWALDAGGWSVDATPPAAPAAKPTAAPKAASGWSLNGSPSTNAKDDNPSLLGALGSGALKAVPHVVDAWHKVTTDLPDAAIGLATDPKKRKAAVDTVTGAVKGLRDTVGGYTQQVRDLSPPEFQGSAPRASPAQVDTARAAEAGIIDKYGVNVDPKRIQGAMSGDLGEPNANAYRTAKRTIRDHPLGAAVSVAPFVGPAARALEGAGATAKLGSLGKAFSPATVSQEARDAAQLHRTVLGERGVQADIETHRLAAHAKTIGGLTPEGQRDFINYVENRSRGAKLADPRLQKAADALRGVSTRYRSRIEYLLGNDSPSFIRDYYAHMWQQKPEEVEAALKMARPKQGSGRNMRARTVPTYEEGLKGGLKPRFDNPVDAMIAYNENMAKFLGTHEIRQGMVKQGQAQWFKPGEQPAGWVDLKGAGVERVPKGSKPSKPGPDYDAAIWGDEPAPSKGDPMAGRRERSAPAPKKSLKDKAVRKQVLYAPPDAARVYNNHISQGLGNNPVYRGARAVSNALTQAKLGLSAFHLSVMGREGIVSEMAKGVGQLSRGKVEGLKTIAKSPTAPVSTAMRGGRMFNEMVGAKDASPEAAKLNALYAKAGGRLHMDRIYSVRGAGSFYNSLKRGTFIQDLKSSAARTYTGSAAERAKGVVDLAGNMIQSVAAPLFEDYVPAMKRGAWASRMEAFLKENPGATERDLTLKGQQFLDNIDNRFGELMVDNNFWHKAGYQISQLLLLSPSWNLGTVREIGGGLADIPKSVKGLFTGKGVTDKTAYLAALAGYTMLENGIMTKLKTGDDPDGMDWFSYRTGGVNADGSPERAQTASYMKDIMALSQGDPGQELVNKANPGVKAAYEAANNSDWRGDPIYPTHGEGDWKRTGEWALENVMPIGVESFTKGDKAGSNLSPAEKLLGTRPANAHIQNPERAEAGAQARTKRRWKTLQHHEMKDKAGSKDAKSGAGGWKVEATDGWKLQ